MPLVPIASNSRARRALAGAVLVLFIVAIAVLVFEVRKQLDGLRQSAAENVQWSLGQAETEIMWLEIAILEAKTQPEDPALLDEVKLRFDVVYSRIDILRRASVLDTLRQVPNVAESLSIADAFRQDWVPIIDGPPEALRADLDRLYDDTEAVRREVRQMALDGVILFAQVGDARRDTVSATLSRIGMLTVALIGILIVLILAVLRLARQRESEAARTRETRDRMETILSTALDAVVAVNRAGKIVEYNGAAERVFGYTQKEALGAEMVDLLVPARYRASHQRGMSRFITERKPRMLGKGAVQLEGKRKDGSVFPCDFSLALADSPSGEIFVAFVRDISDRVAGEEALRRALDQAIAGERQKADLLAVMSHEMRTPLNGILGTLELFESSKLDDQHRRYLRIVKQSSELLLGHVNEVLDVSRLDAGKMSLRKVSFDLVALLQQIIDGQAGRANARGNVLDLAPPNPILHRVYTDPDRLRQILLNLVGNAIKFTRNGQIVLETEVLAGLDEVEFRVIDSGVGIAQSDLDRIFDDFVTIDSSYGRSNTGTGLGLSISKRLARVLGGQLGAESELGEGSVFWLRLPLAQPEHVRARGEDTRALAGSNSGSSAARDPSTRVLVVEDNKINREVVREMLQRDGHVVTEAQDGAEGIELAAQQDFDVVLMDISMPGMDGLEAARRIRKGKGLSAAAPIIATTAHALPQEVEAFQAAGMNTVLVKPITARALRSALQEVSEHPVAADGKETAGASATGGAALGDRPKGFGPKRHGSPQGAARTDWATREAHKAAGGGTHLAEMIDWHHFEEVKEDLPAQRLQSALLSFGAEMEAMLVAAQGVATGADGDASRAALSMEAHRLAGSAGVFGALPMAASLRAMQRSALDAKDAELSEAVAALQARWDQTAKALRDAGYQVTEVAASQQS